MVQARDAQAATQRMQVMWDGIAPVHSKHVQVSELDQIPLTLYACRWQMLVVTQLS